MLKRLSKKKPDLKIAAKLSSGKQTSKIFVTKEGIIWGFQGNSINQKGDFDG